ncbi:MAG: hypothetical protein DI539_16975 [Flavobacterium psychrophilum]|nr:MAG: hypothetical protein DI539_16975 [Flavobacterium psychrophilum]
MLIIDIYIVATLFFSVFFYTKRRTNAILILVLSLAILNEVVTKIVDKSSLNMTVYTLLHNLLWYYILYINISQRKLVKFGALVFISFSVMNFIFFEGIKNYNFNTFILGAFIYIAIFIYESFYQLKRENFIFFQSNTYILLFSPVLFFFVLSFIFGFKSQKLAETYVFGNLKLYDFIGYFVNIIYYTLINIYTYRERKLNHA